MQTILLVDINDRIALPDGKKEKYVARANRFSASVELVGQNTYWQARASKVTLKYSIRVRRVLFRNESFVWLDNKLFKIENIGKAKDPNEILLNVSEFSDTGITDAIKRWIDARSAL